MPLTQTEPTIETGKMNVIASAVSNKPKPVKDDKPVKPQADKVKRIQEVKPSVRGKAAVLQEAEMIRRALRETLGNANSLIREVKAQKRQDVLLKSTMDSLRKLNIA